MTTDIKPARPNMHLETYRHEGFVIKPKRDFGKVGDLTDDGEWRGWVVTDCDGLCNVLPGATWAATVDEARECIDAYIEAGGSPEPMSGLNGEVDVDKFWSIVRGPTSAKVEHEIEERRRLTDVTHSAIEDAADTFRDMAAKKRRRDELTREINDDLRTIEATLKNLIVFEGVLVCQRGDVAFKISEHELDEIIELETAADAVASYSRTE